MLQDMPQALPERAEAGTVNVPGIAGLAAGLEFLIKAGVERIGKKEKNICEHCINELKKLGFQVYSGDHQGGTVSFLPPMDCQEAADRLAKMGIALRAGLHCAPLAHKSAGTLETGTVRLSFGYHVTPDHVRRFLLAAEKVLMKA
jgi:selenocysteine lyase/cysteine desulfurase